MAAAIGIVIVAALLALGVLFARDRVLTTRVLAHVDASPGASGNGCVRSCRGGRILLL